MTRKVEGLDKKANIEPVKPSLVATGYGEEEYGHHINLYYSRRRNGRLVANVSEVVGRLSCILGLSGAAFFGERALSKLLSEGNIESLSFPLFIAALGALLGLVFTDEAERMREVLEEEEES